jgi:hypothetical protein
MPVVASKNVAKLPRYSADERQVLPMGKLPKQSERWLTAETQPCWDWELAKRSRTMSYWDRSAGQQIEPAFAAWICQWKLGVLDAGSAVPVLQIVLRGFARNHEAGFWYQVEKFLALVSVETAAVGTGAPAAAPTTEDNPPSCEVLFRSATALSPKQARQLLQFLGKRYPIGSDSAFWPMVTHAMEISEGRSGEDGSFPRPLEPHQT